MVTVKDGAGRLLWNRKTSRLLAAGRHAQASRDFSFGTWDFLRRPLHRDDGRRHRPALRQTLVWRWGMPGFQAGHAQEVRILPGNEPNILPTAKG